MEFLIKESQLRVLLQEEKQNQLGRYMENMYGFTKQIISKVFRSYGINLRMLLTWGTSVGGLVLPLDQFLRTQHLNLTEEQRMLVLSGIIFSLFFETKRPFAKLMSEIKKEGLENIFKNGLDKASKLKNAFSNFLMSIGTGTVSFLDTVAYSFLIPIIPELYNLASQTQDIDETAIYITKRVIASGMVLISAQSLNDLLKNILKRTN
jgi:hypothetical protein